MKIKLWIALLLGFGLATAGMATTVISTSFDSGDGYSDGDLAGQASWLRVDASGSNAFTIANSGGAGDAVTSSNNYDTVNGNGVYWNQALGNEVHDAIDGYIDFKIKTVADTNTGLAIFDNTQDILVLGLTADGTMTNAQSGNPGLDINNDLSSLISVKVHGANGSIQVQVMNTTANIQTDHIANMTYNEVGWDPKNANVLGPDFETDELRLAFKLRKTSVYPFYQGSGYLSNLVTTISDSAGYFTDKDRDGIYTNANTYFVMGHYKEADGVEAEYMSLMNVEIYDLVVNHTSGNLPEKVPPTSLVGIGSQHTVTVGWNAAFEAESFNVYRSETTNGTLELVGNTAASSIEDNPVWNNVTNYYQAEAVYTNGVSSLSEQSSGAASPVSTYVSWGIAEDIIVDNATSNNVVMNQNVFGTNDIGGGETLINVFQVDTPFSEQAGAYYLENTPLRGIVQWVTQTPITNAAYASSIGHAGLRTWHFNNAKLPPCSQIRFWVTVPQVVEGTERIVQYVDGADWDIPGSCDATLGKTTLELQNLNNTIGSYRFAIRNNGDWYLSQQLETAAGVSPNPASVYMENIAYPTNAWGLIVLPTGTNDTTIIDDGPLAYTTASNAFFTDIDAVGVFWKANADSGKSSQFRLNGILLTQEDTATPYEYWVEANGVTGGPNDDDDGDGWSNKEEFGIGGDPQNSGDAGAVPEYELTGSGIVYVHTETREPSSGAIFDVEVTSDLTTIPGSWTTAGVTPLGTNVLSYHQQAVSNLVPTSATETFIQLNVQ